MLAGPDALAVPPATRITESMPLALAVPVRLTEARFVIGWGATAGLCELTKQ
jgi:hypothetical protein